MKRINIVEILPYLYLSGQDGAARKAALAETGITHILNVMDSCRTRDDDGFLRAHIPISDYGDSDLAGAVDKCCDFIERTHLAGGKVLLHCGRGQNRSPTVATAYLMRCKGMTLREAFFYVRERRPEFAPHENYLRQLQECEQASRGCVTLTEDAEPLSIQQIVRKIQKDISDGK